MLVHIQQRRVGALGGILVAILGVMVAAIAPVSIPRHAPPFITGITTQSVVPQLNSWFQANTTVISPENQDGINDEVQFSFTTNINTVYNLTIEEDLRMVDTKSRHVAIAGNASRLIMMNVVDHFVPNRISYYNVTVRDSTDGGITWSPPVEAYPLSQEYDDAGGENVHRYAHINIVQNQSDGTFFLMVIDDPSWISEKITVQFFSSADGYSWNHVSTVPSINITGIDRDLNVDITISKNKTEILGLITENDPTEVQQYVYFIKSSDGGYTWVTRVIATFPNTGDCFSPAIAVSPTTGSITCVWFYGGIGSYYYYVSRSFDYGGSWSPPLRLDAARGIGQSNTPSFQVFSAGTFTMLYEPSGMLKAFLILNKSTILYLESSNDGSDWLNGKAFRSFGTDVNVYAMDFLNLGDGNSSLCFTSTLNGNIITNSIGAYASSYYLRTRVVRQYMGYAATGGVPEVLLWDGKDQLGRFVDDAPYLARLAIRDAGSSDTFPEKLETRVIVDNARMNLTVSQPHTYFSPIASPGLLDTMDIGIKALEDGDVDLFIAGSYASRASVRASTSLAQDFRGDTAVDRTGRLWCVYTSYEGGNGMDIYLKKSDDQGITFSISQPLVSTPYSEDCPAIAIYENTIYVVFQQFHPTFHLAYQYNVYDIFMIRSEDLGRTWTFPMNLTAAEFFAGSPAHYFSPDIAIQENGTVHVSWSNTYGPVSRLESIKSINGTYQYTSPVVIGPISGSTWNSPAALAIDESMGIIYAATGRLEGNSSPFTVHVDFYNSSNGGSSWSPLGSYTDGQLNDELFRGITLDVYDTNILRASYLTYRILPVEQVQLVTIESMDGVGWTPVGAPVVIDTGGLLPPLSLGLAYSCDLRSGRSSRGGIYYTYDRLDDDTDNRDVFISIFTNETKQLTVPVYKDTMRVVSWDGSDYWGNVTSGYYAITIVATDAAGNKNFDQVFCTLDNQAPRLQYVALDMSVLSPSQNVSIPIRKLDTDLDYWVTLRYRFSETMEWIDVWPDFNGTHYNGVIPANSSFSQVFFYVTATDLAENTINLMQKFYFKPNPDVVFVPGSEDPERKLDEDMQIIVDKLPFSNITAVYLDYSFDGAASPTRVEMVFDNNTRKYVATLPGSQQHTSLQFSIHIVRTGSNQTELVFMTGTPFVQEYIPAFPEIAIGYPGNIVIVIISSAVGFAFGMMQAHGKKTSMKKIKSRFDMIANTGGTPVSRDSKETSKQFLRGRLMYNVMMAGTIGTIGGGLVATFALGSGGSAMLVAGFGMLLSALALMERVSIDSADAIFAGRKVSFLPVLSNTFLIVGVLVVFMVAGPKVDWFNYYIVKESFSFGGVSIPKLWLSLITPMVTSVLLIVVSSYRDLKNSLRRFDVMQSSGDSWRVIWQAREEAVSKLNSNVALKMFVFLVTIVFALVSTTQIGQYAEEGMLFLLPFIIAWFAVGLVAMFLIPSKQNVLYGKIE